MTPHSVHPRSKELTSPRQRHTSLREYEWLVTDKKQNGKMNGQGNLNSINALLCILGNRDDEVMSDSPEWNEI